MEENQKSNQVKFVLNALFDVRPVDERGNLDLSRVKQIKEVLDLREEKSRSIEEKPKVIQDEQGRIINLSSEKQIQAEEDVKSKIGFKSETEIKKPLPARIEVLPTKEEILAELESVNDFDKLLEGLQLIGIKEPTKQKIRGTKEAVERKAAIKQEIIEPKPKRIKRKTVKRFIKKEKLQDKKLKEAAGIEEFYFPEAAEQKYVAPTQLASRKTFPAWIKIWPKSLVGFIITGLLITLIIPTAAWLSQGLTVKEDVLNSSLSAYQNLLAAQQSLEESNWLAAEQNFGSAHSDFYQAHQEINKLGQLTLGILERLPGGDLVSSGSHLVKVGENLAQAGQGLAAAVNLFSYDNLFSLINSGIGDPELGVGVGSANILEAGLPNNDSLTDLMVASQKELNQALAGLRLANQELEDVEVDVLPDEIQSGVASLKEKLPLVEEMLNQATAYSTALLKVLGHDNPRQYLLIFQNNSELRATGGFVGTYGLLTLDEGVIDDLFIDGVFNADGQLHEKIIPPRPIQKISTAWSMHDANWFADFPASAQKIQWFYEKTGGPTTDGIISLTPVLVERLLELTGPIDMPQYKVILNADNFIELIQYKVEVDYDKELNRPKKILADFAPLFIRKLSELSSEQRKQALEIIFDCLEEKHILIYFNNFSLEQIAIKEGWSGEILETDKDYLSVVSSNINGFKTDRMINETINHQVEIQEDGSIINTLIITRQHQGGQEKYDWWNRVNANYLRVYLPQGSKLISAQGQSLEIYQPPIDYQKQGFKNDSLVKRIEDGMVIDGKTGTQIFQENNKTVFGNWVYVSPGETVRLVYKYKLPFKIDLTKSTDSYSLLAQKQSGSLGSNFKHQLKFPENWQISWQHPDNMNHQSGIMNYRGNLKTDKFLGVTFGF